jgi:hypothetical protein
LPIASSGVWEFGNEDIGLEVQKNSITSRFYIKRISGDKTTGIRVCLRVTSNSAFTITPGTATGTLGSVATIPHPSTMLTQVAGRVGIGIRAPASTLHVAGATTLDGDVSFPPANVRKIVFNGERIGGLDTGEINFYSNVNNPAINPWALTSSYESCVLELKVGNDASSGAHEFADSMRLDGASGILLKARDRVISSCKFEARGGVDALDQIIKTTGQLTVGSAQVNGSVNATGSLSAGSLSAGSLAVSGNVSALGTISAGATTLNGDLAFPSAADRKIVFISSVDPTTDSASLRYISNENDPATNPWGLTSGNENSVLELKVANDAKSAADDVTDSIRIDGASGIYLKALDRVIASCKVEARGGVNALDKLITTTGPLASGSLTVTGGTSLRMTTIVGTNTSQSYPAGTDLMVKADPIPITGATLRASGLWGAYSRGVTGGDLLLTAGDGGSIGNNGSAPSSIYGGDVYVRAGRASSDSSVQGSAIRTYAGAIIFQSGVLNRFGNADSVTYVTEMKVQNGKVGIGVEDPASGAETLQVAGSASITGSLGAGATTVASLSAGIGTISTSGNLSAGKATLGSTTVIGDLRAYRPDSPAAGFVFLHNGVSRYLQYDGTRYRMPDAPLSVQSLDAGSGEVTTTGTLNAGSAVVSGDLSASGTLLAGATTIDGDLNFVAATTRKLVFKSSLLGGSDYASMTFIANENTPSTNPWAVTDGVENGVLELKVGNDARAAPETYADSVRIDGASGIYLKAVDRVIASCKVEARGGLDALGTAIKTTGNLSAGSIVVSGNVSATGTLSAGTTTMNGDLTFPSAADRKIVFISSTDPTTDSASLRYISNENNPATNPWGTTAGVNNGMLELKVGNDARVVADTGSDSLRIDGASGIYLKALDRVIASCKIEAQGGLDALGTAIKTTGTLSAGQTTLGATRVQLGDLTVYRSGGTVGVVYLHDGINKYLTFDGTSYRMPNAPLVVDSLNAGAGAITTTGLATVGTLKVNGNITSTGGLDFPTLNSRIYFTGRTDFAFIQFLADDDSADNPWGNTTSIENSVLLIKVGDNAGDAGSDSIRLDSSTGIVLKALDVRVRGPLDVSSTLNAGATTVTSLYSSGDITSASDKNLKCDIVPIDNALQKARALRSVYFRRRADPERRQVGLIAQEVEDVVPEAVCTNADGMKSVAYGNLVAVCLAALTELEASNASRMDRLEARLTSMETEAR